MKILCKSIKMGWIKWVKEILTRVSIVSSLFLCNRVKMIIILIIEIYYYYYVTFSNVHLVIHLVM